MSRLYPTMSRTLHLSFVALFGLFMILPGFIVHAQSQYQNEADIPARVGRVAYLSGGVQFYAEADPQWRTAFLNAPVTSHNSLLTEDNGRAEIRVGATALTLAENGQLDIHQLDDAAFSTSLPRGSLSVRVGQLEGDVALHVSTSNGDFDLQPGGRYRVDADAVNATVTVFAGQAQAFGSSGSMQVDAGKSLRISNTSNGQGFMFVTANFSSFDRWVQARDDGLRVSQAAQYVSRNMTGYEDLDANGRWDNDSDYGRVWYPTTSIAADWAPYRYGHWAWVAPWGWTWMDDAAWGFAPFHYGRWVSIGGRWGWTPGAYVARPVFAPALVGFYGGDNFNFAFSIGGAARLAPAVGWYPLAPWERYAPGYSRNATYINRVNNITINNPPARYAGRDDFNRINGATVIRQADFGNRQPAARLASRVPDDVIRRAPLTNAPVLPQPSRFRDGSGGLANAKPQFNAGRVSAVDRPSDRQGDRQIDRPTQPTFERVPDRRYENRSDGRSNDQGSARPPQARIQETSPVQPHFENRPPQINTQMNNQDAQRQDQARQEQRQDQMRQEQRRQDVLRQEGQRQDAARSSTREFERRQPVRMESMPVQPVQPGPALSQQQVPPPVQQHQRPEQPRVEQPRVEQPRGLNVDPQPAPSPAAVQAAPPSRFNQGPQEQRGDNQGSRGGSRFRPPDQQ